MKRVRCPKCESYILFDEKRYSDGQSLVFKCPDCGKQFGIKLGESRLHNTRKEQDGDLQPDDNEAGYIAVIENAFHYKQAIPLRIGNNVIGRHVRGNGVNCPIETCDPSMDENHCTLNVSRDRHGSLVYRLKDGPSNTGTFVGNELLGDRENRIITDGTLFTIGATSVILHASSTAEATGNEG